MPVLDTEIVGYLTGGKTNTDKKKSIGGEISDTVFPFQDLSIPNLFDKVDEIQSTAGYTDYRCIAIKNTNATLTLENARVRIASETTSTTQIEIGADPIGVNIPSSTKKAHSINNAETAPLGVTFVRPKLLDYTALLLGSIPPNQVAFLWIKWVISPGTKAQDNDMFTLEIFGGTVE